MKINLRYLSVFILHLTPCRQCEVRINIEMSSSENRRQLAPSSRHSLGSELAGSIYSSKLWSSVDIIVWQMQSWRTKRHPAPCI